MNLLALVVVIALATNCNAFAPRFSRTQVNQRLTVPLFDAPKYTIVPVEKETVANAASVTGGIVGFLVLGPIGGVVLAALSNWLVKKDNEGGEALRGVGKSVVEAYNYLNKINSKLDITGKVGSTVGEVVEKVSSESESAANVKAKIAEFSTTAQNVITEYDLVTKASALARASADLSETALEKLDELNQKYDFVETAKKTVGSAVEKGAELVKEAKESK